MATKSSPLKSIHESGKLSGGTTSASADASVARQIAEAIRVARAAGRRDVTRTIHRPGRDHEHCRRRLDAERRRAANETHVRWQLASLVVDAKQPLSKRRERNWKRETDSRVLIHANDPLDRRPVRPVGGSDFEHQRPRRA